METNSKMIVIAIAALLIGGVVGAIAGTALKPAESNDDTYHFYLYFDADDTRNGWYSAKASDAGSAFDKAMKDAGMEYRINNSGYIAEIDGDTMDYSAEYLWSTYDKTAASESVKYPVDSDGIFYASNGWRSCYGYDGGSYDSNKICESNAVTFLISHYDVGYTLTNTPVNLLSSWSTASGTPFATS